MSGIDGSDLLGLLRWTWIPPFFPLEGNSVEEGVLSPVGLGVAVGEGVEVLLSAILVYTLRVL